MGLARDVRTAQRLLAEQSGVPADRMLYYDESLVAAVIAELAAGRSTRRLDHGPGG